nr:hypothetical protein [Echinicola sp. 20G]
MKGRSFPELSTILNEPLSILSHILIFEYSLCRWINKRIISTSDTKKEMAIRMVFSGWIGSESTLLVVSKMAGGELVSTCSKGSISSTVKWVKVGVAFTTFV